MPNRRTHARIAFRFERGDAKSTGKLDVRKAAAQLPDEAGGEEPFDETEFPTDNGEGIEDFDDIVASEETEEP